MDSLVDKYNLKFLFIGGAPRSGTTLLVNLLDSHPELICFPTEHSTIEKYFWNKENLKEYFLNDFIKKRREGQQTILASKEFLEDYSLKIKREYYKDHLLDIDTSAFQSAYLNFLKTKQIELKEILFALCEGLLHSNSYSKSKLSTAKYIVFKQPYFTDLFAKEVSQILPDCKFINVRRDPIARYASAKKRRLAKSILKNKTYPHINGVNFVRAHSEVDISTFYLSERNKINLGSEIYTIVKYEEIIKNPEKEFLHLFKWLNLSVSPSYKTPTILGNKVLAGSAFVENEGIDKNATDRMKEYFKITSWNERILHKYYLGMGNLNNEGTNFLLAFLSYLLPFKHEPLNHFIYKYIKIYEFFYSKNIITRLEKGVENKKLNISGAI
jgi:hypothetical protein